MRQVEVIDLETLGMAPPLAAIEFGSVRVAVPLGENPWVRISTARSSLHGIPDGQTMAPDNRAIHHIDPASLTGLPLFGPEVYTGERDEVVAFCAHNAAFEAQWVIADRPWICTYKLALRAWPEVPSHSNNALKYLLGIPDRVEHHPPHRALPDAIVTAEILLRLLPLYTFDEMVQITSEPVHLPTCPIGKFRGVPWPEVEGGFLHWIMRTDDMRPDVKHAANLELTRRRRGDPPPERTLGMQPAMDAPYGNYRRMSEAPTTSLETIVGLVGGKECSIIWDPSRSDGGPAGYRIANANGTVGERVEPSHWRPQT